MIGVLLAVAFLCALLAGAAWVCDRMDAHEAEHIAAHRRALRAERRCYERVREGL